MGDTTTEVDAHEQIRKVLEDRMGEYFRPGHDTWRLNSANLARVVGDIVDGQVAAELDRLIEDEAVNVNESGYRWRGIDVEDLRRRASELRGEGKDGDR